jgi:L-rhamnose-H+ transport protein
MLSGMAWILLASAFLGTFALPAKYVRNYAWENTWGAFFLFAMLVVPVAFAAWLLQGLVPTYQQVSGSILFAVVALGFLWGAGFCLWGHGLARLGLSLGYALTMGTMALCGSMLPFFLGHADRAATRGGLVVIAGILVCIVGVAINGIAGVKRERAAAQRDAVPGVVSPRPIVGVVICVLAGLLSSGCNIAFHVGSSLGHIDRIAVDQYHNAPWLGGLAVWTLIFIGGLISSFGFAVIQLTRNGTWKNFGVAATPRNLGLALVMALGHFGCLYFYGLGGWKLGALGTSVGFAIFQTGSVLIGNGLGFLTGEWRDAAAESKRWLAGGLSVLIVGIVIVSAGNLMQ